MENNEKEIEDLLAGLSPPERFQFESAARQGHLLSKDYLKAILATVESGEGWEMGKASVEKIRIFRIAFALKYHLRDLGDIYTSERERDVFRLMVKNTKWLGPECPPMKKN